MPFTSSFAAIEPRRAALDALPEPMLLEFGTPWCPHCQAVQAPLRSALATLPGLHHIKVEDGPGRRLGRSFGVKLWPTLVLYARGRELGRVVRPADADAIRALLKQVPAA